ncbi:MAG: Gfo/Idh/MocA family oxidoreductase [Armatimonadetes bacterium]|nr:Gfo/Idh/MocA family oxidoreductase [Armatimonadota bacterium]
MADTKGFGVIGAGVWGETHLMAYAADPYARLVGVCDINAELARQRAEQYGAEMWTTDWRELLARDDVDAVSIVTPDFLHREMAVAAAEAGKHVLLEKPMATSMEDAEAIAAAARKAGVLLMVDFHNRWNPAMVQIKQAVDAGELGELQVASIRLNDTIWVPTGMLSWGGNSTVVWFLGSHSVDLVRWLFSDEVARVYAVSRSKVLAGMGVDTPDFFHYILELKRGGVAHIENCWIMSESMPTVFDFKLELIGSEGTVFADCSSHRMVQKYTKAGGTYPDVAVRVDIHGRPAGFGVESIRAFVRAVVLGEPLPVSIDDGVENTRVLVAVHESARTGQPVQVR